MNKNIKLFILVFSLVFNCFIFSEEILNETENQENTQQTQELPHLYTVVSDSTNKNVITKEQIEQMNVQSVTDIFQKEGIQVLSYGDYGTEQKLSIRGFTDETVRVVIDGVCVNNPLSGTFDFSTLNVENIEKIEIIRGGFNEGIAEEGAVGGVVIITTKKQSLGHTFSTDTFTKTYFYYKRPLDTFGQTFNYSGQLSDSSFLSASIKGIYAENLFLYLNYSDKLKVRENANAKDINGDLTYSYYFGNGNSFTIFDNVYAGSVICPGRDGSKLDDLLNDINNRLTLSLQFPSLNNSIKWESSLNYYTTHEFYHQTSGVSNHNVDTVSAYTQLDFNKLNHYKQNIGLSFEGSFLDSTDCGVHQQFKFTAKESSKIIFTPTFYLTIPIAFSMCDSNYRIIPKIALTKDFKHLSLTADSYRMVQFPILTDMYWKDSMYSGNPNLKPEDGIAAELIFDFKNIYIPFTVNGFTYYYFNKIKWTSVTTVNVASAFYAGCNLKAEKSFFEKKLSFVFNAEYLYSRLLDKNDKNYGNKIMWTPDLVMSLICFVNLQDFTITTDINYMGVRYTDNANIVKLDPYVLGNVCVQYKGLKNWIFYTKVQNIFNTDYQCIPKYPQPLINMTLGVKFKKTFQ